MLIREAQPSDAPAIATVHVDAWRCTYRGIVSEDHLATLSYGQRGEVWREILSRTDGLQSVFVAEEIGGEVVGFANGGPEGSDTAYAGELYAVYILERSQRKGVGRRLTAAVAKRLLQDGMGSMLVWVLEQNSPARRFYEKLGGALVREQDITIGGATLGEVAYGWDDISALADTG
jgi:GNAT superfamily N-acetyltransferase